MLERLKLLENNVKELSDLKKRFTLKDKGLYIKPLF